MYYFNIHFLQFYLVVLPHLTNLNTRIRFFPASLLLLYTSRPFYKRLYYYYYYFMSPYYQNNIFHRY